MCGVSHGIDSVIYFASLSKGLLALSLDSENLLPQPYRDNPVLRVASYPYLNLLILVDVPSAGSYNLLTFNRASNMVWRITESNRQFVSDPLYFVHQPPESIKELKVCDSENLLTSDTINSKLHWYRYINSRRLDYDGAVNVEKNIDFSTSSCTRIHDITLVAVRAEKNVLMYRHIRQDMWLASESNVRLDLHGYITNLNAPGKLLFVTHVDRNYLLIADRDESNGMDTIKIADITGCETKSNNNQPYRPAVLLNSADGRRVNFWTLVGDKLVVASSTELQAFQLKFN